ncbi:hypothetical protein LCGC14_1780570 [marine sediment metagenome]|uniref:Uncharacterized protein n=1 Tax=marine sediment metagenome TaxID=412755 RepID=A0A0F9GVP7_9ZZZZ
MEDRRERVLQALHILVGDRSALTTDEEKAIIKEYRELCSSGYGRMEVVVVAHRLEGINPTRHKKRKDLLISPQTT